MSALINLLPDVRLAKLAAKRYRHQATMIASIVVGVSASIVLILLLITQGQKMSIQQLSDRITAQQNQLSSAQDLSKIITLQQHLQALPQLYQDRAYMTKFYDILGTVSPRDITLQSMDLSVAGTVRLNARARNYGSATKFVRALETSNNLPNGVNFHTRQSYFKDIALSTVSADNDGRVDFSITMQVTEEATRGGK